MPFCACPSGFITPSSYTCSAASAVPPHAHTFNHTEMEAHLGDGEEVEGDEMEEMRDRKDSVCVRRQSIGLGES